MKDLNGPFNHRVSALQEGFDLKFVNQAYAGGVSKESAAYSVKIMSFKLFSKQEYFCIKNKQLQ